jgi:hypothetical protein
MDLSDTITIRSMIIGLILWETISSLFRHLLLKTRLGREFRAKVDRYISDGEKQHVKEAKPKGGSCHYHDEADGKTEGTMNPSVHGSQGHKDCGVKVPSNGHGSTTNGSMARRDRSLPLGGEVAPTDHTTACRNGDDGSADKRNDDLLGEFVHPEDFATPGPLNQADPMALEAAFRTATAHLPQMPAPKRPDCMFMASLEPSLR